MALRSNSLYCLHLERVSFIAYLSQQDTSIPWDQRVSFVGMRKHERSFPLYVEHVCFNLVND